MIRGGLLTQYFLEEGIQATEAYRQLDHIRIEAFVAAVRAQWDRLSRIARPSEAETEAEFIHPVLDLLGWHRLPQQEPGHGRRDIADELLFLTEDAKATAARLPESANRFRHGAVVVENEARDTPLGRASRLRESPEGQIQRYLSRAETISGGAVCWGLLTNGRFWRMYWAKAPARAEGFVEIELPALFGDLRPEVPPGADVDHWVRVFLLLFGQTALLPVSVEGGTFLELAMAEGKLYEQRVTAALSTVVFDHVFPDLIDAIAREAPPGAIADPVWRADAREAGLRLLYRLLFLLYAEDRDLLPVRDEGYAPYSLRKLRLAAASPGRRLASGMKTWWPTLAALFQAISVGNTDLGLPPYNGGLFDDAECPLLGSLSLPDAVLAVLIDAMSRVEVEGRRQWINYRDLSVQQLGAIYERLLERDVVPAGAGVTLRPNAFARKTSGSFYTPDELVQLILRRTIGPLLAERRHRFQLKVEALANDRRPVAQRLRELAAVDPATSFVELRICDPAMGSGHFLVSLVDYLAGEVLDAIAEAPALVTWANDQQPYRSPLAERVAALRGQIEEQARQHGWPVRQDQLDDRHLVRRIVLKRTIYGVDLNPMAVELAKLALWLHSFTVGAPLSFLDHHLRCGDSLFGERVGHATQKLGEAYGLVTMGQAVVRASKSASGMAIVEALTDADLEEVRGSKEAFQGVEEATAELRAFLDLWHASSWLKPQTPADTAGRGLLFGGGYGDPVKIAAGNAPKPPPEDAVDIRRGNRRIATARDAYDAALSFLARARVLARERRFLHWEAAFPGVWDDWERASPPGGFDAVIGNPPWDRMKMQEVEWFAARVPEIAKAQRASDRKRMIAALRKAGDPVAVEYDAASDIAEGGTATARDGGSYPLLSGGDINLYSLFVERAVALSRTSGIVGLVVPSGIAADKGAADFFKGVSTTGRLGALLDFENRRNTLGLEPFFPDVDSRFKFCVIVMGGPDRRFDGADCAFFQQDAIAAEASAFRLSPADFSAVNPNTSTAPVFRTKRDAALTLEVYARLPVLMDRRVSPPRFVWPVRYERMFDMTNDSGKFRTEAELVKDGAYRVEGGGWEKGSAKWVRLYEGKMVQAFDHRAASVIVNVANLNRPAQPAATTTESHADPAFQPRPQFWIAVSDVEPFGCPPYALGFKDVTSPTNVRTMIASAVPYAGYGNTLPVLLPTTKVAEYKALFPLMLANLNAFVLDYVARQKVQGQHLNAYILEQLPIIPPDAYARPFGPRTAEDIIREDVLHLTYTAHDMAPFARDQGYAGPPFAWDEEDRLRRRARLDAVFFHLYGVNRDDAEYILSTFPIVKREEERRYAGRFRSRDLILAYMNALAAGAPDARVAG